MGMKFDDDLLLCLEILSPPPPLSPFRLPPRAEENFTLQDHVYESE